MGKMGGNLEAFCVCVSVAGMGLCVQSLFLCACDNVTIFSVAKSIK